MKPLYSLEIDVSDHECDRYARWANYGLITAEGNDLMELLDNAQVDIMDQDGGELDVVAADSNWMQDLIETEYNELLDAEKERKRLDMEVAYSEHLSDEMKREG